MAMRIAIVGAGVSGLTCGVVLAEGGRAVTIVAKEVEGTTSEAAAAIWYPYHVGGARAEAWAEETRVALTDLANDVDSGVSLVDFDVDGEVLHVPLADTSRYLPYLRARFDRAGGAVVQREIGSFEELASDVVVNCTGFGARTLCDDRALTPGYGVSIVTSRPSTARALVRTSDPLTYVIPRTNDCILGGYDAPEAPSASEVDAIVPRCVALVPELRGDVRGVKHGIRPIRFDVRLEREGNVIHNYGHGGSGFTLSWACARAVALLV
jgi:D-amino-acid oxidase